MNRREFFAASATLLAASPAAALKTAPIAPRVPSRQQRDDRFETLCALVAQKMEEFRIPGVAFGVRKNGQTLVRGFGMTNVDDPQPVTPETVFPLASISKTVAATAIMRLVEQGRMELDAPVQRYVPVFRVRDEAASRAITVRHLLTHSPGFEGQLTGADRGLASLEFFVDTVVRDLPLLAPPGTVWSYNNAGFTVAGRVIELVSGRDIHAALRELVFTPLGMTRSFTRIGDVVTYRFAQGHNNAGGRVQLARPFALSSSVTAGGVAMSIDDLLSYAAFHMGEATGERAAVLRRTSLEAMRLPQLKKAPTEDAIGISWHLRPVGGVMTLMHGGTAGAGHRLLLELVPERSLAFAILTNHVDGWRLVEAVERATLRTYEDMALAPSQPIVHRGINEAMTSHATPLASQPDPREYVGTYRRTPGGTTVVRDENGSLLVGGGGGGGGGAGGGGTRITFYGKDVAYSLGGANEGSPYEFVRRGDNSIGWIRINGRVAARE